MHVIWKRPDGYHGASPEDFLAIDVGSHSRLWLHKSDKDAYPFRVSGGWEEDDTSHKLNNFVNLLGQEPKLWLEHLNNVYSHSMKDSRDVFIENQLKWLRELSHHLKGDSWEVDIMDQAINLVLASVERVREEFTKG